jgi:hypothetical protein
VLKWSPPTAGKKTFCKCVNLVKDGCQFCTSSGENRDHISQIQGCILWVCNQTLPHFLHHWDFPLHPCRNIMNFSVSFLLFIICTYMVAWFFFLLLFQVLLRTFSLQILMWHFSQVFESYLVSYFCKIAVSPLKSQQKELYLILYLW